MQHTFSCVKRRRKNVLVIQEYCMSTTFLPSNPPLSQTPYLPSKPTPYPPFSASSPTAGNLTPHNQPPPSTPPPHPPSPILTIYLPAIRHLLATNASPPPLPRSFVNVLYLLDIYNKIILYHILPVLQIFRTKFYQNLNDIVYNFSLLITKTFF